MNPSFESAAAPLSEPFSESGKSASPTEMPAEEREFREQCRRQMERPIESRMLYGFCRVYRPVMDDAAVRIFSSTRDYRDWCAAHLPAYLGYQPAPPEE